MTGRQFARVLRNLPAAELDLEVGELVDRYDRATCRDCGRSHPSVWAALACDGLADARRRLRGRRQVRQAARVAAGQWDAGIRTEEEVAAAAREEWGPWER